MHVKVSFQLLLPELQGLTILLPRNSGNVSFDKIIRNTSEDSINRCTMYLLTNFSNLFVNKSSSTFVDNFVMPRHQHCSYREIQQNCIQRSLKIYTYTSKLITLPPALQKPFNLSNFAPPPSIV